MARTWLFDQFITRQISEGADLVLNLGAGLDARPYRMDLPRALKWVEVDLPGLVDYKEGVLKDQRARCELERVAMDLADVKARRGLFERVGRECRNGLVITEGILIYLSEEEVAVFAHDLAAQPGFRHWLTDLASPGLLRRLQQQIGGRLENAGAPLKFGPAEGTGFFAKFGWKTIETRSMLKTGAKLKRLPFYLRFPAMLPEPKGPPGRRPWGGAVLMERWSV